MYPRCADVLHTTSPEAPVAAGSFIGCHASRVTSVALARSSERASVGASGEPGDCRPAHSHAPIARSTPAAAANHATETRLRRDSIGTTGVSFGGSPIGPGIDQPASVAG